MTPALKAMVEAMAAEIERQTDAAWLGDDGQTLSLSVEGGSFDLEKVARAALSAAEPILLAEFEADAIEQQRMDDAVAAEWEGVPHHPVEK